MCDILVKNSRLYVKFEENENYTGVRDSDGDNTNIPRIGVLGSVQLKSTGADMEHVSSEYYCDDCDDCDGKLQNLKKDAEYSFNDDIKRRRRFQ